MVILRNKQNEELKVHEQKEFEKVMLGVFARDFYESLEDFYADFEKFVESKILFKLRKKYNIKTVIKKEHFGLCVVCGKPYLKNDFLSNSVTCTNGELVKGKSKCKRFYLAWKTEFYSRGNKDKSPSDYLV